jgi:hypothetical protein
LGLTLELGTRVLEGSVALLLVVVLFVELLLSNSTSFGS